MKTINKNFGQNDAEVAEYAIRTFAPEDAVLEEVRLRSEKAGLPQIHVGIMDARHLEVLVALSGAKKVVEIGTLAGYSGVSILRGMGAEGKLYTFEFDPKHAEVASETFVRSGFKNQVSLLIGPALENLPKIESEGPFDLVFIDADKVNYTNYLNWAAQNLRIGGSVIADNTFAWGKIADPNCNHPKEHQTIIGLRQFNEAISKHTSFKATILPTGEGLTVGVRVK